MTNINIARLHGLCRRVRWAKCTSNRSTSATFIAMLGVVIFCASLAAASAANTPRSERVEMLSKILAICPEAVVKDYHSEQGVLIVLRRLKPGTLTEVIDVIEELQTPLVLGFIDKEPIVLSNDNCRRIAHLPHLISLDLTSARLQRDGLKEFAAAEKLQQLELPTDIRWLAEFDLPELPANIDSLDISKIELTPGSWERISRLEKLSTLELNDVAIVPDGWEVLKQLPSLSSLKLSCEYLEPADYAQLAGLPHLTSLDLVGGSLGRYEAQDLCELPQCGRLHLYAVELERGFLRELQNLAPLQTLEFVRCRIEPSDQRHFEQFAQIRSLVIHDSTIDDAALRAIGKLTQLEQLEVNMCGVTDDGARELHGLIHLEKALFAMTGIGDDGLATLATLPKLTFLDVQSTSVSRKGLLALVDAKRVESLSIRNTSVVSADLPLLAELPKLRRLNIGRIRVLDGDLDFLAHCELLEIFAAEACGLDDDDLRLALNVPTLDMLEVPHNPQITSASVSALLKHPKLSDLSIEGCSIGEMHIRRLKAAFAVSSPNIFVARSIATGRVEHYEPW